MKRVIYHELMVQILCAQLFYLYITTQIWKLACGVYTFPRVSAMMNR